MSIGIQPPGATDSYSGVQNLPAHPVYQAPVAAPQIQLPQAQPYQAQQPLQKAATAQAPAASAQQPQVPQQQTYQGSGGGSDPISGIIQSGVDTGAMIAQGIQMRKQLELTDKYRREDLKRADQQRLDFMTQQGVENAYNNEVMKMNQAGFDFGKQKWGAEFGLTMQQYNDQKKLIAKQMRDQGLMSTLQSIKSAAAEDGNVRDMILSRFGV